MFEELYRKAKTLTEPEFVALCSRILLQGRVVVGSVYDPAKPGSNDIAVKISVIADQLGGNASPNLLEVQAQLKEIIEQVTGDPQCMRPCCRTRPIPNVHSSALSVSTHVRQDSSFYKADRTSEYFNRYYSSSFDAKRIFSVEHTKM